MRGHQGAPHSSSSRSSSDESSHLFRENITLSPLSKSEKAMRSDDRLPQWMATASEGNNAQRGFLSKVFTRRFNFCQFLLGTLFGALLILAGSSTEKGSELANDLQYKFLGSQVKYYHKNDANLLVVPRRQPKIGIHSVYFGAGARHGNILWLNVAEPNASRKTPPRGSPAFFAPVRTGEQLQPSYNFTMDEFFRLSIGTMKRYAERWDYPYWLGDNVMIHGPQADKTTGMWTKQAVTLSILMDELRKPEEARLEWLFFADADFVVANQNVPLTTFLPPTDGAYAEEAKKQILLISNDRFDSINSGAYMFRVCEESIKFLLMLEAMPIDSKNKGFSQGEQTAITRTAALDEFVDKVSLLPGHLINANAFDMFHYPENWGDDESFHLGDWAFHFLTEKRKGWDDVLRWVTTDKYDYVNSTFAVPLNSTRYISGKNTVKDAYQRWFQLSLDDRRREIRKYKQW